MTSLLWFSLLLAVGVPNLGYVTGKPHEGHAGHHVHGMPYFVPIPQSPAHHSTNIRHIPPSPGKSNPLLHHISTGYYNEVKVYPEAVGKIVQVVPPGVAAGGTGQQTSPAGTVHVPMVPYHPVYIIFGHMMPTSLQQGVVGTQGTQTQPDPSSGGTGPISASRGDATPETCTYQRETGFCYLQTKCAAEGGRVTTYCRDFTKSCCIFNYECGETTDKEVFHFRNSYWPLPETLSESCPLTVRKKDTSVCYFKIKTTKLSLPASIGYCDDINFQVGGLPSQNYAKLCGEFDPETEYYVDVKSVDMVTLKMFTNTPTRISWNILVVQVSCSQSPGTMWPKEGESGSTGGVKVTPVQTPADPEPEPAQSPEKPSPTDTSGDVCGISHVRSLQVRDRGQVSATPYGGYGINTFGLPSIGKRRQVPVHKRDDEEEFEEKSLEAEGELNRDSAVELQEWAVPTVDESILAQYAGPTSTVGTRITYGEQTKKHEYPWAVAMYSGSRFHCGGSLISNRHVLTAAHCVLRYKRRPGKISLSVGDWDISSQADGKNIVSKVSKIETHPGYSTSTLKYDVAVLTLKEPVTFSNTASPVCLPPSGLEVDGKLVTVTGWGRDERNRLQSVLMQHSANVVTNKECNKRWKETGAPDGIIADAMLCMDPQDGDSCKGDSGGPCIMEYPEGSSKYIQVGIVSFGSASCTDRKLPGVYTDVSKVVDWIKEQMK